MGINVSTKQHHTRTPAPRFVNKMTYTKTRAIRLTDAQVAALESLAAALEISGKGGARLNPLIARLAETAAGAMAETAAALEIAAGCAAGEDWDELIKAVRPRYDE